MLHATQLMDSRVPRVRHDEPRDSCVRLLGPRHHLLVVDDGGRLAGLLTRRHLEATSAHRVAGALAHPAATVTRATSAWDALQALLDSPLRGVVVIDDDGRPDGLVSMEDAVQVARFVLPPRWKVGDLIRPGPPPSSPGVEAPGGEALSHHHEARMGADRLAVSGRPIPVAGDDGQLIGAVTDLDVVRALVRWLRSAQPMLVDPIP